MALPAMLLTKEAPKGGKTLAASCVALDGPPKAAMMPSLTSCFMPARTDAQSTPRRKAATSPEFIAETKLHKATAGDARYPATRNTDASETYKRARMG